MTAFQHLITGDELLALFKARCILRKHDSAAADEVGRFLYRCELMDEHASADVPE